MFTQLSLHHFPNRGLSNNARLQSPLSVCEYQPALICWHIESWFLQPHDLPSRRIQIHSMLQFLDYTKRDPLPLSFNSLINPAWLTSRLWWFDKTSESSSTVIAGISVISFGMRSIGLSSAQPPRSTLWGETSHSSGESEAPADVSKWTIRRREMSGRHSRCCNR